MIRSPRAVVLALLGVTTVACTSPPADTTQEARAGIAHTNEAFMAAAARGDAAGIAACYTEDGEILPPNADSVRGREGIEATFAAVLESGVAAVSLESSEVEGHGDSAWEVGRYELRSDEESILDAGSYIVIWRRVGEEWKLHRDIWNSDLPVPDAGPGEPPTTPTATS